VSANRNADPPRELDLKKDEGLRIVWADGRASFYPVAHLRKMSPSAEARELRSQMQRNPLTVLTGRAASTSPGPLAILDADLVGNYAIRFRFSDGHTTGIYSWEYLRSIDPAQPPSA
jgi:DUF971 family protein